MRFIKNKIVKYQWVAFFLLINSQLYCQNWVQKASLPTASSALYPFCFSIGGKLYVGGGYNNGTIFNSVYQYDPSTNIWIPKANLPVPLYGGAFFVINGKGYMVCGKAATGFVNSVYMYDPVLDSWTQKNNFLGTARQNTIGFSLSGKGYVFGGFEGGSTISHDMWEYDPIIDNWIQRASAPGSDRDGPTAIVIGNKAYVGLGSDVSSSVFYSDFYNFDPLTNTYIQMASLPSPRNAPVHFSLGGFGYVGLGFIGSSFSPQVASDLYKYDPSLNVWTQVSNFNGPPRGWCISDTVSGKPYIGTGADLYANVYYTDLWTWANICNLHLNLGNDTILCNRTNFTITDTLRGVKHRWSTGDSSASITVTTSGSYWLMDSLGSCITRDTVNVTFANFPQPFSLGNDTTYCGSFSRSLSTGMANTYWSTGVNGSSILVNTPGVYWAEISNQCGTKRDSILLVETPMPIVNLGNDTVICNSVTLTLNATIANGNYIWQDGSTSPTKTVTSSNTYSVKVTVNGCSTIDTVRISYIPDSLSFDLGNDTSYCSSFSRSLSTGNANTHWSTGVNGSSILVNTPGLYWAEISNQCGTKRDSILLVENPLPIVNLGNDTVICNNDTLMLNATTANATYIWQDGSTSPTKTVTNSNSYSVKVTVNGCSASDTVRISYIHDSLSFNLGNDTTYCGNFTRLLTIGIANTIWSDGDTSIATSVHSPGLYWGKVISCGYTFVDSIRISQNPLPIIDLGNDTSICQGSSLLLNAQNVGASYMWYNNSISQTLSVSTAGIYWVKATKQNCIGIDSIHISTIYPPTPFSLGSDSSFCEDSSIRLNANQVNVSYHWNTGDTTSSILVNQSGYYEVTDSNECGIYKSSMTATVTPCDCKIAVPTAFSPNDDGKNDLFSILTNCSITSFQLNIYNRWGELVFASTSLSNKWDGAYKGQKQPLGVYTYYVHYTNPYSDKEQSISGNVTLLR